MLKLWQVTITGADDSISPWELKELSDKFPFVEWGILVSHSREGSPRYPSRRWVDKAITEGVTLSLHICGRWVRQIVKSNDWNAVRTRFYLSAFHRIQLNHRLEGVEIGDDFCSTAIELCDRHLLDLIAIAPSKTVPLSKLFPKVNIVPLFDQSGGRCLTPDSWPTAFSKTYCGYAGGIGPSTIKRDLDQIHAKTRDQPFWIDMESKVRSEDDRQFELTKVESCLRQAEDWRNR